jgi:hypothetical protein
MPFSSKAQEGYFNANRAKLEKQGVNVDEWNKASKGMKLPEKKKGFSHREQERKRNV